MFIAIVAVSAATPFLDATYSRRWFAWPGVLLSAQVPILVTINAVLLFISLRARGEYAPFLLTLGPVSYTHLDVYKRQDYWSADGLRSALCIFP